MSEITSLGRDILTHDYQGLTPTDRETWHSLANVIHAALGRKHWQDQGFNNEKQNRLLALDTLLRTHQVINLSPVIGTALLKLIYGGVEETIVLCFNEEHSLTDSGLIFRMSLDISQGKAEPSYRIHYPNAAAAFDAPTTMPGE